MSKEYKVKGKNGKKKKSTKRKLIDKLKKSSSLFERLQKVAKTTKLKNTFGNSINNINELIKIIDSLELDEIEILVDNMRQNIKHDKSKQNNK